MRQELDAALSRGAGPKIARFALACLSGAIPIAGGVIGAAGGTWSETEQDQFNKIFTAWLRLQEDEIKEIGQTLFEVFARIDQMDEKVRARLESKEYLALLKKCFRDWSAAESEEKRKMIRNLLANAAGGERICNDDILRLFVEWIDRDSEGHFLVVRTIYKNPGFTRLQIWHAPAGGIFSEPPGVSLTRATRRPPQKQLLSERAKFRCSPPHKVAARRSTG